MSADQTMSIHNAIRQFCRYQLVLDIGCGDLVYSQSALNAAANLVYAIDIKEPKKLIKDYRFTFYKLDAQSLPFKDETFDVIICIGLIEYVNMDRQLYEIKRLLKKGGYLIFQTKDSRGMKHKLYKLKCRLANKKIAGCPQDYALLTYTLKNMFKQVKYEETKPRHTFLMVLQK